MMVLSWLNSHIWACMAGKGGGRRGPGSSMQGSSTGTYVLPGFCIYKTKVLGHTSCALPWEVFRHVWAIAQTPGLTGGVHWRQGTREVSIPGPPSSKQFMDMGKGKGVF